MSFFVSTVEPLDLSTGGGVPQDAFTPLPDDSLVHQRILEAGLSAVHAMASLRDGPVRATIGGHGVEGGTDGYTLSVSVTPATE